MNARTTSHRSFRGRGRLLKLDSATRQIIAVATIVTVVLAAPGTAAAHVNRTVGPYTFLVVLTGEPYFPDNRAGFRFWVKQGDRDVLGLETTLRAEAIAGTVVESLVIEPTDGEGFHNVEHGPDGRPFDPHGGGDWDLRLVGTIEGLQVDESFRSTLPVYPRVSGGGNAATPVSGATDPSGPPLLGLIAIATGGLVIVVIGGWLIAESRARSGHRRSAS